MFQLLLVDDEKGILEINKQYFEKLNYVVYTASYIHEAKKIILNTKLDCIILDVILSDGNGISFCSDIKTVTDTPIIFLSNLSGQANRINGFLVGCDDYVEKPYHLKELELRIQAVISRHHSKEPLQIMNFNKLTINIDSRIVYVETVPVVLATMEFNILLFLAKNENKIFSQKEIYSNVWHQPHLDDPHTVQVHIGRVRKKLDVISPNHRYIQTVWGSGYKFVSCERR